MPYGAQFVVGLGRQTNVGSGNAVTSAGSFHHIPFTSDDVFFEKQEVISQNLVGRFDQGASYDGPANVAGTLEFEPLPKALGAVMTAVIQAPASVTSASLRTLTFLPRTLDISSGGLVNEPFSMVTKDPSVASQDLAFDVQFSQIEYQFVQGQLLKTRAVVAGGRRVYGGVGSAGFAPTLDTADLSAGFLWDVASISVGGTAIGNLSQITVALNENIEPVYTLNGTLLPYKYTRNGYREVTVQGEMIFDSRSMYNDFIDGTQRQLLITARNTRVQIQSGYYPTLTIDVPQMKITQMKPAISGPGELRVPFQARGVIDPSSNYSFKATLITTYAAGY
jgi:hypothetical protein